MDVQIYLLVVFTLVQIIQLKKSAGFFKCFKLFLQTYIELPWDTSVVHAVMVVAIDD